eukprot:jgi/Bigna1/128387/aug1.6_g3095
MVWVDEKRKLKKTIDTKATGARIDVVGTAYGSIDPHNCKASEASFRKNQCSFMTRSQSSFLQLGLFVAIAVSCVLYLSCFGNSNDTYNSPILQKTTMNGIPHFHPNFDVEDSEDDDPLPDPAPPPPAPAVAPVPLDDEIPPPITGDASKQPNAKLTPDEAAQIAKNAADAVADEATKKAVRETKVAERLREFADRVADQARKQAEETQRRIAAKAERQKVIKEAEAAAAREAKKVQKEIDHKKEKKRERFQNEKDAETDQIERASEKTKRESDKDIKQLEKKSHKQQQERDDDSFDPWQTITGGHNSK